MGKRAKVTGGPAVPSKATKDVTSQRPRRPQQLPLPRFLTLITVQSACLPICLFAIARQYSDTPVRVSTLQMLNVLVKDPPRTLAYCCIGLLFLQLHVGRTLSIFAREDERKVAGIVAEADLRPMPNPLKRGLDAVITLLGASVIFHAAIFLLGAPLVRDALSTYLFALYLTLLSIGPAAYLLNRSTDMQTWTRLFCSGKCIGQLDIALLYPCYGTLFGAWLGAAPIALDWDRPWQRWPIPPVLGGWVGHLLGTLLSLAYCVSLAVEEEARKVQ